MSPQSIAVLGLLLLVSGSDAAPLSPRALAQTQPGERLIFRSPTDVAYIGWVNDGLLLLRLFSGAGGELALGHLPTGELKRISLASCLSLSPDRKAAAFADSVGRVYFLNLSTLERQRLSEDARLTETSTCPWSADGTRLAIPGVGGRISVVDLQTGRVLQGAQPSGRYVSGLTWTRDGQALIIASYDVIGTDRIERYDLRQNRRAMLLDLPRKRSVDSLSFSPDGRLLLFHIDNNPLPFPQSGTPADEHVVVFDGVTTRMLATGEAPAWHPSGTRILYSRRIGQLGPNDYGVFVMDYR